MRAGASLANKGAHQWRQRGLMMSDGRHEAIVSPCLALELRQPPASAPGHLHTSHRAGSSCGRAVVAARRPRRRPRQPRRPAQFGLAQAPETQAQRRAGEPLSRFAAQRACWRARRWSWPAGLRRAPGLGRLEPAPPLVNFGAGAPALKVRQRPPSS